MSYCVGMLLDAGLVMVSDSRTSAGVDRVATFQKMFVYEEPGERLFCLLMAGNLSITQSVISVLNDGIEGKNDRVNILAVPSMYQAARTVGHALREVYNEDGPSLKQHDIEFNASLADGKTIKVVALLTDNVQEGLQDPTFRARYEALSTRADFITYNGHAGLGSNIRALASAGNWVTGQYVVVFMNGCDTFAYIDGSLSAAHKAVNPDDTTGFKYIDIVNNGMPAYFADMSEASTAMLRGFLSYDDPKTYEQIFTKIASAQLVMVTGEHDNAFTPGGGGQPQPWAGLDERGSLARNAKKTFTTPTLAAGSDVRPIPRELQTASRHGDPRTV